MTATAEAQSMVNGNGVLEAFAKRAQAAQAETKPKNKGTEKASTAPEIKPITVIDYYNQRTENPSATTEKLQKATPEIPTSTKITAGDTLVRQYMALKDVMNRGNMDFTKPPLKEYATFIHSFETSFLEKQKKSITEVNPSPDELKTFARRLVEDDMYMIWAIKIAESHQALLQAVTGARVVVPSDAQKNPYLATMYVHGLNSMEEVTEQHITPHKDHWYTGALKRGRYMVWALKEPIRYDNYIKWMTKEPLDIKASSRAARNIHYQNEVLRRMQAELPTETFEYVSFGKEDPQVNLEIKIDGKELDDVQKALLLLDEDIGTSMHQGNILSNAEQHNLAFRIAKYTDAREKFYRHIGGNEIFSQKFPDSKPGQIDDFNMVQRVDPQAATTPGVTEYKIGGSTRQKTLVLSALGFDQIGDQPLKVMVGAGGFSIDEQRKTIEAGLVEHLKPVLEEQGREITRSSMDTHMKRLQGEIAQSKDPETAQAILKKDITDPDGIKFWEQKKSLLEKRAALLDQKKGAQHAIKDADDKLKNASTVEKKPAELNPDGSIKTPATYFSYQELHDAYTKATEEQNQAEKEKGAFEVARIKLIEDLKDLRTQQKDKEGLMKSKTTEVVQAATAAFNELQQRINSLNNQLHTLETDINNKRADWSNKDKALKDANKNLQEQTRTEIDEWIKTRGAKVAEIAKVDSEIVDFENSLGNALRTDVKDPNSPEYTSDQVKAKIEEREKQIEKLKDGDKYKERQLEVYGELMERTEPKTYIEMRNRAAQPVRGEREVQLKHAMLTHPNLPPAYLKLLQDVFADSITQPGSQEAFIRATHLISMDVFMRALSKRNLNFANPNDPKLRDFALNAQVDKQLISDVFDDLLRQGETGELGKLTENQMKMLETIEKTDALDINKFRAAQEKIVDSAITRAAIVSVRKPEVESKLATVSGIDTNLISTYADEIMKGKARGMTRDQIVKELIKNHNNLKNLKPHAGEIVEIAEGIYAEKNAALGTASNIMETSLRQQRSLEDSTMLAAAAIMIHDSNERNLFLSQIERGSSIPQILEFFNAMPQADQPKFLEDFQSLVDSITKLQIRKPDFTDADFTKQIRLSLALHIRQRYKIARSSAMPKDIKAELDVLKNLMDALKIRQMQERYINTMNDELLLEGTIEELTMALLQRHNQSVNSKPDVAYEKMVAAEINDRRADTWNRTQAAPRAVQTPSIPLTQPMPMPSPQAVPVP